VRLKTVQRRHSIPETEDWDPLKEVKQAAAARWVAAVNADGAYGQWVYTVVKKPEEI